MNSQACVYRILNTATGECYVGATTNIHNRSTCHRSFLKNGNHPNRKLRESFNKYGWEHFRLEILELVNDIDTLEEREQYYCDLLNPEFCVRTSVNSNVGIKMPEESSEKKRKAMTGKKRTERERMLVSINHKGEKCHWYGKPAYNRGIPHTEEEKKNIARAKGVIPDEEVLEMRKAYKLGEKISVIAKKFGYAHDVVSRLVRYKTYKYVEDIAV